VERGKRGRVKFSAKRMGQKEFGMIGGRKVYFSPVKGYRLKKTAERKRATEDKERGGANSVRDRKMRNARELTGSWEGREGLRSSGIFKKDFISRKGRWTGRGRENRGNEIEKKS